MLEPNCRRALIVLIFRWVTDHKRLLGLGDFYGIQPVFQSKTLKLFMNEKNEVEMYVQTCIR